MKGWALKIVSYLSFRTEQQQSLVFYKQKCAMINRQG